MDDDGNTSDDLCYDSNICSQSLADIKAWVEGDEYDDKGNKLDTPTTSDDFAVFVSFGILSEFFPCSLINCNFNAV